MCYDLLEIVHFRQKAGIEIVILSFFIKTIFFVSLLAFWQRPYSRSNLSLR